MFTFFSPLCFDVFFFFFVPSPSASCCYTWFGRSCSIWILPSPQPLFSQSPLVYSVFPLLLSSAFFFYVIWWLFALCFIPCPYYSSLLSSAWWSLVEGVMPPDVMVCVYMRTQLHFENLHAISASLSNSDVIQLDFALSPGAIHVYHLLFLDVAKYMLSPVPVFCKIPLFLSFIFPFHFSFLVCIFLYIFLYLFFQLMHSSLL